MQDKILETFTNYIRNNNLTTQNTDDFLKSETFTTFFNEITTTILGVPSFTHDRTPDTKGALVYMPDTVKDRFVESVDIISVNSLYYGVLGKLEYNYKDFNLFLQQLRETRISVKKQMNKVGIDESLNTIQQLIKVYMNLVYGMIDNSSSVLTSSHDTPREFVVTTGKNIVLSIASFFINKSLPVFYIDTDEIHTERLSEATMKELQEYFIKECSEYIDITISTLDRDNYKCISSYYLNKRRYLTGDMSTRGMKYVENDKVLTQNRNYFGRNFPEIFPEYAL